MSSIFTPVTTTATSQPAAPQLKRKLVVSIIDTSYNTMDCPPMAVPQSPAFNPVSPQYTPTKRLKFEDIDLDLVISSNLTDPVIHSDVHIPELPQYYDSSVTPVLPRLMRDELRYQQEQIDAHITSRKNYIYRNWTKKDVQRWLDSLRFPCRISSQAKSQVMSIFKLHGIDGVRMYELSTTCHVMVLMKIHPLMMNWLQNRIKDLFSGDYIL